MDHYRHPEFVCEPDLLSEQLLLLFPVVSTVIKIKAYLANCDCFWMSCQAAYLLNVGIGVDRSVIRVDPDCGITPFIVLSILKSLFSSSDAVCNIDYITQLRSFYFLRDIAPLLIIIFLKIKMCMFIKQHLFYLHQKVNKKQREVVYKISLL